MPLSRLAALLLLTLAACQSLRPGLPPAKVDGLPWGDAPADRLVWTARQAAERGESEQALVHLATVLQEQPRHVDAHRLRQDLLRQRGRVGFLLRQAQAAVRERPEDGLAHYLLARISDDPQVKLAGFRRAAQLSPESVWPWLGLSHTIRQSDRARALQIYSRLFDASDQHPLIAVAYASALREAERWDEAKLVYQAVRDDARIPGVGDLGLAQVGLAQDDRDTAWSALLQALRVRPFDPGVHGLVHGWLQATVSADQERQVLDILREDAERMTLFGATGGALVLAELLQHQGQPQAARAVLQAELQRRPTPVVRRRLRRLALALGDVDAFLARLVADLPRHVIDVESNRLRGRWMKLLVGPWQAGSESADGGPGRRTADRFARCRVSGRSRTARRSRSGQVAAARGRMRGAAGPKRAGNWRSKRGCVACCIAATSPATVRASTR